MSVGVYNVYLSGVLVSKEARDLTPGAGVTGSCKRPDVSTGNYTWVLWKSSMCANY